jgi:glyoxylase-like metal-dependent hydrolase (beta-lactamase superfamily II)
VAVVQQRPVRRGEETAVVDTGYVTHAEQTLALIESVLGTRPLDRILNTHLHSDHCGGNAALQSATRRSHGHSAGRSCTRRALG